MRMRGSVRQRCLCDVMSVVCVHCVMTGSVM